MSHMYRQQFQETVFIMTAETNSNVYEECNISGLCNAEVMAVIRTDHPDFVHRLVRLGA